MSALCGSVCVSAYYLLIIEICMMEIFLLYHHCYCQNTPIKVKLVKIAFCLFVSLSVLRSISILCADWNSCLFPVWSVTLKYYKSQQGYTSHTTTTSQCKHVHADTLALKRPSVYISSLEQDAEHKLAKSVKSSQYWSSAGSCMQ